MAIGTGQVSLQDIEDEFGGSAPIALSEYYSKGNAPGSGEIQIHADFNGTAAVTAASGGSVATAGDYKIHTFSSSGDFVVSQLGTDIDYLIIAGGGGGGWSNGGVGGGGGGAGGYRNSYNNETIDILVKLGIKLGFRANLKNFGNSSLEIPRIDHSEILKLSPAEFCAPHNIATVSSVPISSLNITNKTFPSIASLHSVIGNAEMPAGIASIDDVTKEVTSAQ